MQRALETLHAGRSSYSDSTAALAHATFRGRCGRLREVGDTGFERRDWTARGVRIAARAGINRCAAELNAVPAAFDASSQR